MTDLSRTTAVILAAGRGSRMNAKSKNKVAFKLNGHPMVAHTVDHLLESGITKIIAVVGYQADSVRQALGDKVTYVEQLKQLGTGDAIKSALPFILEGTDTVLAVYGDDSAFYPPTLFADMVAKKDSLGCSILLLTIHKDNPVGLGRIVRDTDGKILRIVEEKNATADEKQIQEINTGFYCFDRAFLVKYLDQIQTNSVTHEYYLTDLVEIALQHRESVETLFIEDDSIWCGVNDRSDFARAKAKIKS
jgi:bifunctional UDP-N-acetylglucosamine pyrophosphorylase/glucosamine-1-phosphate N-acetyltransferase